MPSFFQLGLEFSIHLKMESAYSYSWAASSNLPESETKDTFFEEFIAICFKLICQLEPVLKKHGFGGCIFLRVIESRFHENR